MLECRNITKEFYIGKNVQKVLQGINIKINNEDFITIMGKSGSGKTTFLNCISLLLPPTGGEICLDGEIISTKKQTKIEQLRQEKIGMVFQNSNLIPCLTVLDNLVIAIHEKLSYAKKKEVAMQLLKQINLQIKAKVNVEQLSGGERQRIAILRAIINRPEIVICDEPTGALDAKTSEGIMNFLIQMCKQSKSTLVIVTHDSQIGSLGKRKFVMEEGVLNEV